MNQPRYIVRGPRVGMWKVADTRDNENKVGEWHHSAEDAQRVADACNRAYEEMGREQKSLIARIKEMIAA